MFFYITIKVVNIRICACVCVCICYLSEYIKYGVSLFLLLLVDSIIDQTIIFKIISFLIFLTYCLFLFLNVIKHLLYTFFSL